MLFLKKVHPFASTRPCRCTKISGPPQGSSDLDQLQHVNLTDKQRAICSLSRVAITTQALVEGMRHHQGIQLPQRIGAIAAPPIMRGLIDHVRANRVHLDVALAGQPVAILLCERGFVATVPQRAGSLVLGVDVLNITAANRHDEAADRFRCRWLHQKMLRVGHQHIGLQGVARLR